jgi:cell division protein FtsW
MRHITNFFSIRSENRLKIDLILLGAGFILLMIGMVMVSSASIAIADDQHGDPFFFLKKQFLAALIGCCAAFIGMFIPIRTWKNLSLPLLFLGITLLIIVFIPDIGRTVNGSTRWISVAGINFQVSEPARLCLLIYVAGYLVRRNRQLRESISGFIPPIIILCIACGLLLFEPDYGTSVVLLLSIMPMLFSAGARIRDFTIFVAISMIGMTVIAFLTPERIERLYTFLEPWEYSQQGGFQLTQSLIAFGRGDWFGVGLGNGVQKLFYLPEVHTDFIFAVLVEELGLFGALVMILLFTILVVRIFQIALKAARLERLFEAYLSIGIGSWLAIQTCINIGVNIGALPTKGLTLPLVSYGRSSLIITIIAIGMILRISHEISGQNLNQKRASLKKTEVS